MAGLRVRRALRSGGRSIQTPPSFPILRLPLAKQDGRRRTLGACDNSWENRREVPARTKPFFCRLEFRLDSAALTFQLHRLLWLVIFHTRCVSRGSVSPSVGARLFANVSIQLETLLRQTLLKLLAHDPKRLGRRGEMLSLFDPRVQFAIQPGDDRLPFQAFC